MTNTAVVVALNSARTATVKVERESACGKSCTSCRGCVNPKELVVVTAVNRVGAKPGDRVIISGSTRQTLLLAALVYLLPIALFIIGWMFHPMAGVAGALSAAALIFVVNRRIMKKGGVKVYITDFDNSPGNGKVT